MTEQGLDVAPIPVLPALVVTLWRLFGVLALLTGMVLVTSEESPARGLLIAAAASGVAGLCFWVADGIRRRRVPWYLVALALTSLGVVYDLVEQRVSTMPVLLVLQLAPPTRRYVRAPGPPGRWRRGPLTRLDTAVLGPPGSLRKRLRRR